MQLVNNAHSTRKTRAASVVMSECIIITACPSGLRLLATAGPERGDGSEQHGRHGDSDGGRTVAQVLAAARSFDAQGFVRLTALNAVVYLRSHDPPGRCRSRLQTLNHAYYKPL